MSAIPSKRVPPGFGLRQCGGVIETCVGSSVSGTGAGAPHSGTLARSPETSALPRISPLLLRWFTWYCRGYVRRHFHSLRISINGLPPDAAGHPVVLYANHASWWDPIIGLIVKDEWFRARDLYAPIDAGMLERYRMFGRMGFFGVEPGTRRGAVQFLRVSEKVLRDPNHLLALTPQGRFADVRERPLRFQCGLGRLAGRVERALFLPLATEICFWEERLPEILIRFGEPVMVGADAPARRTDDSWSVHLEQRLQQTMDALAQESVRRDPDAFRTILSGGAGQGGVYDLWRGFRAMFRGESFAKEHGCK